MAYAPMLPLWTDAYLGDTRHLSTLEHGAYLLLLITAWRSKDGVLPDDDKMLSKFAGLTIDKWRKIRPTLEPFFSIENGVWAQGRLLDERKADSDFRKSQSKKAKDRHLKNKETTLAEAYTEPMPPLTPTLTPIKEERNHDKIPTREETVFVPENLTYTPALPKTEKPKRPTLAQIAKWEPRATEWNRDYFPYGDFRFSKNLKPEDFPENYNPKNDFSNSAFDPIWIDLPIIKLRESDFNKWMELSGYSDERLTEILTDRDKWLQDQPPPIRKNWFVSTSKYLDPNA